MKNKATFAALLAAIVFGAVFPTLSLAQNFDVLNEQREEARTLEQARPSGLQFEQALPDADPSVMAVGEVKGASTKLPRTGAPLLALAISALAGTFAFLKRKKI